MAPQPYANGNWFYNKDNGHIDHITNILEKMWYETKDNEVPFRTKADAEAYGAEYQAHKQNPSAPNPSKTWWYDPETGEIFHGQEGEMKAPWIAFATEAEAQAYAKSHTANLGLGSVGSGIMGGINAFITKITSPTMWLRIAEVVIGGAMVIIGLGKLTGMGDDLVSIGKKAAKVAVL